MEEFSLQQWPELSRFQEYLRKVIFMNRGGAAGILILCLFLSLFIRLFVLSAFIISLSDVDIIPGI